MASGEIKGALQIIEQRGFEITGDPSKILRATGYDGSWSRFLKEIPDGCIVRDPNNNNRFTIIHPDKPKEIEESSPLKLDIDKWSDRAVNYVLGDANQPKISDFQGKLGEHLPVIGALACKIDDSIAWYFYPPETQAPMEIYKGERSLYYISNEEQFSFIGCCAIEQYMEVA